MKNLHSEKYITNDTELDVNEKISTFEILKLMQKVTFAHSQTLGLDHQTIINRDSAFWVITKMKFILNHPISANQKITLKTWTHVPQAVRFLRDIQIKDKNKLMIKGRSEWCCLDYKTRTLRRANSIQYPDLEMVETKSNNINFSNLKLDVNEKDYVYTRTIMPTDIDVNLHTNNLKYTNIALDALTFDELRDYLIKEYEIYFVNETKLGDKIDVYKKKIKNLHYIEGRCVDKIVFRVIIKYVKMKKED